MHRLQLIVSYLWSYFEIFGFRINYVIKQSSKWEPRTQIYENKGQKCLRNEVSGDVEIYSWRCLAGSHYVWTWTRMHQAEVTDQMSLNPGKKNEPCE